MSSTSAERVLRLTFQFLNLSRDVDRNLEDSLFRDEDGEIIYVFDANIFEVFMRPFDPRGQSTSLHAIGWKERATGIRRSKIKSLGAQTALLTTEFLLSGDLPGQKGGKIYLTEWHSWEFARRVRRLVKEHGKQIDGSEFADRLKKLNDVVRAQIHAWGLKSRATATHLQDSLLEADLSDIQAREPLSEQDQRSFVLNRKVLELLANDENLEPVEQLTRLLSAGMRRRIRILHTDFKLPEREDAGKITRDARRWLGLLREECVARGIRVVEDRDSSDQAEGERVRHLGALKDDARTLAVVRWVAVNCIAPGQRIVLVTADPLMFDVYRMWYGGLHPGTPEYAEPFFLRRLMQYAPVFNLADSRTAIGEDVRLFFQRLQSVIEVTLLPVNLARQGRSVASQALITRLRETTALKLLEKTDISKELAYRPLAAAIRADKAYEMRFEKLLDEWRRLERTTLGIADEYVRRRLLEKKRAYPDLFSGELSQWSISSYIQHLIAELYESSLKLWAPLARTVVLKWEPPKKRRRSRAPIAFRLYLADEEVVDLGKAIEERLSGRVKMPLSREINWGALQTRPHALFGLAACLALASEDWSNADHFAEMALREPPVRGSPEARSASSDAQSLELRYLNALTKRFKIGMIGPARNADALARIRRARREAADLLDSCIEHHHRKDGGHRQTLRLVRAFSERAALNLFYAAALARDVRIARIPERGRNSSEERYDSGFSRAFAAELRKDATDSIALAQQDLIECFELTAQVSDGSDAKREILDRMREQFSVNTAAACVLRRLIVPDDLDPCAGFPNEILAQLVKDIDDRMLDSARGRTPLLVAELLAFLSLMGNAEAAGDFKEIRRMRFSSSLSLDVALFSALLRRWDV